MEESLLPNQNNCNWCRVSLKNKYAHAQYCSHSCRAKAWRIKQAPKISVKLKLTTTQFYTLKTQADSANLLINQFIINKATSSSGCVHQ